jgi:sec-independent protein translocase protein TatC
VQPGPSKRSRWNSPEHNPEEFRLSLVGHLEELRKRLIWSLQIVAIVWCVSWFFEKNIRLFMTNRANASLVNNKTFVYEEVIRNAPDAFMIKMKISFMVALIIAFPFIVMQVWAFIAPGLKPNEQKPFQRLAPFSLLLFLVGAGFGWLIIPAAYQWFGTYMQDFPNNKLQQEAGAMALFSLKSLLAFGIGFQLPLVVYVLGALNLLSAKTLMKYWRHAAVAIFFISGAITPSNDPISMLMMAIPLTLLFMISAWAVKKTQAKKQATEYLWAEPEEDKEQSSLESSSYEPLISETPDQPTEHEYEPSRAENGSSEHP